MSNRQRIIAIILVVMMVMAAGCAGWGTDGPTGEYAENESDSDTEGYGEETQTQAQEEANSTESNDSYSEGSDAGAQSSSASADDGSGETSSQSGDSDESTDEAGQTGDGDSQSASEPEVGSDVTCSEFDSHAEAQAYYEEDTDARTSLDADNDGVACESLQEEDSSESESEGQADDGPYTYSLTVQVVDEDGNPVSGELVQFDRPSFADDDPVERITDENGEATFSYEAETREEYMDYQYTVRGEPRGTERVDVGQQTEQVVVSDDSERETYQLDVYAGESYPVEGVDVTIERQADGATFTKTTGEDGLARFEVYPGEYTVTGVGSDQKDTREITVEDDRPCFLDIERPSPPQTNVTFTVMDRDGDPVEGAEIIGVASNIPPSGADDYIDAPRTDASGQTEATLYSSQTYTVQAIQVDGDTYPLVATNGEPIRFETDGDSTITFTVERPSDRQQQQVSLAVA